MKKKKKNSKTTRTNVTVFHQIVQFIPPRLIEEIASPAKIKGRVFTYTSHILCLMLGHFLHAFSLNELCDIAALHAKPLLRTRGITAPKRNTFSNANRTRDPKIAEAVYWQTFKHLQYICPKFGKGFHKGNLYKFVCRNIYAIDATVIKLAIAAIDWAKHRRRKAAAKVHMLTDVVCMLPRFVIVDSAKHHDSVRAEALCKGLKAGDILLADRAYNDFEWLYSLNKSGVFFVLREKTNMKYHVVKQVKENLLKDGILADQHIKLAGVKTQNGYPIPLRRVEAEVLVDGKLREMCFITNNMKWAASTIADLYKSRWTVETLFKELKQTLQLQDFYGENENAVKWQIWTALLTHLLLRFIKYISKWNCSFSRLVGVVRSAIWVKFDFTQILSFYGTAPPPDDKDNSVIPPYLPGFEKSYRKAMGQHV